MLLNISWSGSEDIARQFGGLGLGLAIAKATIAAHGGRLSAESEGVAKGATFILGLPLQVCYGGEGPGNRLPV